MRRRTLKPRLVNWGCVAPALLYVVIAIALVAGAAIALQRAHHAEPSPASEQQRVSGGTLTRELARCQALGRRAEDDPHCLAVWVENRRRFFGPSSSPKKASQP